LDEKRIVAKLEDVLKLYLPWYMTFIVLKVPCDIVAVPLNINLSVLLHCSTGSHTKRSRNTNKYQEYQPRNTSPGIPEVHLPITRMPRIPIREYQNNKVQTLASTTAGAIETTVWGFKRVYFAIVTPGPSISLTGSPLFQLTTPPLKNRSNLPRPFG
jgi:hypothetical protein